MNVKNCRKCGRLFNYISGPFMCPECRKALEETFQEVKKYVFEHPGATILEVADLCQVEPNQIKQWIREERLQFSEDSAIKVDCEKCGTMIKIGRASCRERVSSPV